MGPSCLERARPLRESPLGDEAHNKTVYKLGKGKNASQYFHDVTTGQNGLPDFGPGTGTPIAGFSAGPGYDLTTGMGSPIASALVPAIAKPGNG
jgi:hypothetical protein